MLAALIVALGAFTSAENSHFLTQFNFLGMLLLASALVFISLGQLTVLLAAGIDLSVGPLSRPRRRRPLVLRDGRKGAGDLVLGILAVIGTAVAVGLDATAC